MLINATVKIKIINRVCFERFATSYIYSPLQHGCIVLRKFVHFVSDLRYLLTCVFINY